MKVRNAARQLLGPSTAADGLGTDLATATAVFLTVTQMGQCDVRAS